MERHRPHVLDIGELSSYLRISKSTLYKLAQKGKVPGQKVGKHWRFHRDAIDRWLASQDTEFRRSDEHGDNQE